MLTPEQIEQRRHGIGSSDVSAVVGQNPYRNAHDVWLEKRGLRDESEETDASWLGSQLEAVIALRYELETGTKLMMGPGTVAHAEHPWALATTDRERTDGARIVEAKWVGQRVAWHWTLDADGAPPYVHTQAQWQMWIRGIDNCDIAVIFGGTAEFRIYEFARNDRIISALAKLAGAFWHDHVLTGAPPPIDGSASAREVLRALFPRNWRPLATAPVEAAAWVARRAEAKRLVEQAEAEVDLASNKLIELIADADGIVGDFGVVTFRADKNGNRRLRVAEKQEKAA